MTDVRQFFSWPPADILENVEIFSNGPMTTAFVVLNRPGNCQTTVSHIYLQIQAVSKY